MTNELDKRIEAYNKCASVTNDLIKLLMPVIRALASKAVQVVKKDGMATVRLRKALDPLLERFRSGRDVQCYLNTSQFSGISVTVVVSYNAGNCYENVTRTTHLADVDASNKVITAITPFEPITLVEAESIKLVVNSVNAFCENAFKHYRKITNVEGLGYFDEFLVSLQLRRGRKSYYLEDNS